MHTSSSSPLASAFSNDLPRWDRVSGERLHSRGGGGSSPLLDFDLQPVGSHCSWRNVAHKWTYRFRLEQHQDATPCDNLGHEVTEALRRTILRQIEADNSITPHSTVHFVRQSNAFKHAFHSTFSVAEFKEGSEHLDTCLQSLAQKLNSNQEFSTDDSFTIETTFIHTLGPGSSCRKKHRLGQEVVEKLLARKQSVITIKNKDQLCCARAIVTMRAWVDHGNRHPDYENLKLGCPIQTQLAQELH